MFGVYGMSQARFSVGTVLGTGVTDFWFGFCVFSIHNDYMIFGEY